MKIISRNEIAEKDKIKPKKANLNKTYNELKTDLSEMQNHCVIYALLAHNYTKYKLCICAFFLSKNYTTTQPSDSLFERINKNNIKSKYKAI